MTSNDRKNRQGILVALFNRELSQVVKMLRIMTSEQPLRKLKRTTKWTKKSYKKLLVVRNLQKVLYNMILCQQNQKSWSGTRINQQEKVSRCIRCKDLVEITLNFKKSNNFRLIKPKWAQIQKLSNQINHRQKFKRIMSQKMMWYLLTKGIVDNGPTK